MDNFKEIVQNKADSDLLGMVYQFDGWSPEILNDVEAQLFKRGILPNDIVEKKQRLIEMEENQLFEGRDASPFGLLIGWLTLFGLLGIFFGYQYAYSKVRSKYTDRIYFKYNETSRKHGNYLFVISILLSALVFFYKLVIESGKSI